MSTSAYWGPAEAVASLVQLAYLERSMAHIMAGWVAKMPSFDVKLLLGLQMHHCMERATSLRSRIHGLCHATADEPAIASGWVTCLSYVDSAKSPARLIAAVYLFLYPRLIELYQCHLRETDPDGDRASIELAHAALETIKAEMQQGTRLLPVNARSSDTCWTRELRERWEARRQGEPVMFSAGLWRPVERVRSAARPAGMHFSEYGSYGMLPLDPLNDPEDIGRFLHLELDEEYTTLELIARNSYEHPDMPWQFHRDMIRQASDEARHAQLITRLMSDRGFRHGDFEISTSSYDSLYEFEPCEPGSSQELLWRMLIRQTFMEGLAVDNLAYEINRRKAVNQNDIATVFEYILRDEVFHAQSGLRWSAELLGHEHQGMLKAREEAVQYFSGRAEAIREDFVLSNLDRAMQELEAVEAARESRGGLPQDRPLNRTGRLQAGYTDQDISQIIAWGYATEET